MIRFVWKLRLPIFLPVIQPPFYLEIPYNFVGVRILRVFSKHYMRWKMMKNQF